MTESGMTDTDQITLYSCHICGYCETSLPALTKHTATHIKSEIGPPMSAEHLMSEKNSRDDWSRFTRVLAENRDGERRFDDNGRASGETDGSDVELLDERDREETRWPRRNGFSEKGLSNTSDSLQKNWQQDGVSSSESVAGRTQMNDEDVVLLEEDNLRSPQIGDVFPTSSYPVTTQSRVIFPYGWSEAPTQRTTTIRMPTDQYRNVLQTQSASTQETSQHSQRLPKIINCTSVRSGSVQSEFHQSGSRQPEYSRSEGVQQQQESRASASMEYPFSGSMQPEYTAGDIELSRSRYRPIGDNDVDTMNNDGNSVQFHQEEASGERNTPDTRAVRPSASHVARKARNNASSAVTSFNKNIIDRPRYEPHAMQDHSSIDSQPSPYIRCRSHLDNNRLSSHNSAFSSYSSHDNNYFNNNNISHQQDLHYSNTSSLNNRTSYEKSLVSSFRSRPHYNSQGTTFAASNSSDRIHCPVPLPNNGNFIPGESRSIQLPPSWNRDNVSGFLLVPIKKTSEIAIQTDESCLSADYLQYRSPAEKPASYPSEIRVGNQESIYNTHERGNVNGGISYTNNSGWNVTGSFEKITSVNCHACNKEFPDQSSMQAHYDKFHKVDDLKCCDCGRKFQSAKNMQLHRVRVHNKRMPFRCGVCGLRFEDRSSVVQHLATHSVNSDKSFTCDLCGKKFQREEKLKKHLLKHKDMWHKCDQCDKSFGSMATLKYHTAQVHKQELANNGAWNTSSENTNTDTNDNGEMEQNIDGQQANKSVAHIDLFTCQHCKAKFNDFSELEWHLNDCPIFTGKPPVKSYRCAACLSIFPSKSLLIHHCNTAHLTPDGYLCTKCPRKFRVWSKLKLHIKSFHGLKRAVVQKFPCKLCTNVYSSRMKLADHMKKTHPFPVKLERNYTCKECKKCFKNLSSLMVHRRGVHALNILESPSSQTWECPHCNIDRLTKKTYIAHLKEVHNLVVAEKGRSLEIVGKDDASSAIIKELGLGDLVAPEIEVNSVPEERKNLDSPSKKFNCSECGADFVEEKKLKNHLGLVHGEKPFSCHLCSQKFSYSGQLVWHMRDHGRKDAKLLKSKKASDPNRNASNKETSMKDSLTDPSQSSTADSSLKLPDAGRTESGMFPCKHCGVQFPDSKRLNNHLGVQHGYKNFACDICDQKFAYSTHLIWHKRSHYNYRKVAATNESAAQEEALVTDQTSENLTSNVDENMEQVNENEAAEIEEIQENEGSGIDQENEEEADTTDACRDGSEGIQENTENHDEGSTVDKDKKPSETVTGDDADLQTDIGIGTPDLGAETLGIGARTPDIGARTPDIGARTPDIDARTPEIGTGTLDIAAGVPDIASETLDNGVAWTRKDKTRFICSQCDAKFVVQREFIDHMLKSHDVSVEMPLVNELGKLKQPQQSNRNSSTTDAFVCEVCGKRLLTLIGWKVHRSRCHGLSESRPQVPLLSDESSEHAEPNVAVESPISQCNTPNLKTPQPTALLHSAPQKQPDTGNERELGSEDLSNSAVFSCSKCSRIFTGLRNLRTHQFKMHSIKVKDKSKGRNATPEAKHVPGSEVFRCGTCDYRFSSEKGRKIHCKKMMHSEYPVHTSDALVAARAESPRIAIPENAHTSHTNTSSYTKIISDNASLANSSAPSNASNSFNSMNPDSYSPAYKKARLDDSDAIISPCEICDIEFDNFQELRKHFQEKHPEELAFVSPESQFDHQPNFDQENSFLSPHDSGLHPLMLDCPKCPKSYATRKGLNAHLSKAHKLKGSEFMKRKSVEGFHSTPDAASPLYNPGFPSYDTSNSSPQAILPGDFMPTMIDDLNGGADDKDGPRKICSICQRSFTNRRGLTMHLARFHHLNKAELRKFNIDLDLIAQIENEEKLAIKKIVKPISKSGAKPMFLPEPCPLCTSSFPNRRSLGTHIFKRHGIRCKKLSPAERRALFSKNRQALFNNNNGSQHNHNAYKDVLIAIDCPVCNGKFVGKRGLRAHVSRIHSLDKVELGFLLPEKYRTNDAIDTKCSHCERRFNNVRIYAAHLYFVHKVDHDASIANDDAVKPVYRCTDSKCQEAFKSALELLVHLRAKNGRNITDADVVVVNAEPRSEDQAGDDVDDGLGDDDVDDDFDDDDVAGDILVDEAMDQDPYEDNEFIDVEDLSIKNPAKITRDKLACFACKKEFDDEESFKAHYEKAHGKMSAEDAEKLRDIIERSKLQTDAVSNEYSLRETASRRASRSEIELNERFLSSPTITGHEKKAHDEGEAINETESEDIEEEGGFLERIEQDRPSQNPDDGLLQPINDIEGEDNEMPAQNDHGINDASPSNSLHQKEAEAMNEASNEHGNQKYFEDEAENDVEASKRNFFAAALNLKVTP